MPFFATVQDLSVTLDSLDDAQTADDESNTPLSYAIVDLDALCDPVLPWVVHCPNVPNAEPIEVGYDAACALDLPIDADDPATQFKFANCPCLFFGDYVPGHRYLAIGVQRPGRWRDFRSPIRNR